MKFRSALIVDDHPLFCDALSMTLKGILGIEDIRTAPTLSQALVSARLKNAPDIIFLDLNLPDVEGMDGLIKLKAETRRPVVVVSSMSDDRVISFALRSGADGFVPKHSHREVFSAALDKIATGGIFVPSGFIIAEDEEESLLQSDASARLASLTDQQTKILHLICEGKLNKQIAYDLTITEATVKAHITAIMRKLGVNSRTQAALLVKNSSFASILQ